ncbi:Hypothetical protein PHPALM_6061 [Phytophthora palmivora]|uniref:Uncharacterized protein n=1 Tax=Phytophthora palmivora TaxID=4796 RepID=A0A2P4YFU1_9STRA|nr:Hypothetical protein PHPALM_6061 [Phytophthora palmivora]
MNYILHSIPTTGDRNATFLINSQHNSAAENDLANNIPYLETVGSIMYLTHGTRETVIRGPKDLSGTK